MADFRFNHRIEVRFRDCDQMGHVNNAVYFTYLEQSRFAYWRQMLLGRVGPAPTMILARAECDFRTPAVFGDVVEVRLRVASLGRTSFTAEYEIVDSKNRHLIATAKSVQVMYDYAARQPVQIPDDIRDRIQDFEGRSLAAPRSG